MWQSFRPPSDDGSYNWLIWDDPTLPWMPQASPELPDGDPWGMAPDEPLVFFSLGHERIDAYASYADRVAAPTEGWPSNLRWRNQFTCD